MPARRSAPKRPVRVAIIGAGLGGIAAAVKLQRRTSATFVIFEQSAGVGGTWYDNRYPGCEVDIHSHAYSYSFFKYDWARTHATQPELLRYANDVVDAFGLRRHLRLQTKVTSVVWEEAEKSYRLHTECGQQFAFDVVISAVGLLNVPWYPDWPGLADFTGACFHTSRWEDRHITADKRVAVVGTGSTAAQVVPGIADRVSKLLVFQREPGWVEPKSERPFTPTERIIYRRVPGALRLHRWWLFYKSILRFKGFDAASRTQARMRTMCEEFIDTTIDDPQTRDAVRPSYPWGCKRPILASTFYPALNRPNVRLVPHAVTSATPRGIVDERGVEHEIDVLILSTGFQPTKFLVNLDIKGRDGASLQDVWMTRATAFLGVTVPRFPNFFILYGPNTNGGLSLIAQIERQAEVAVRAVRKLERGRWRTAETDERAKRMYVRWIDGQIVKRASAMEAGCNNYYHTPEGRNVTQWPGSHLKYLLITKVLSRLGLRGG